MYIESVDFLGTSVANHDWLIVRSEPKQDLQAFDTALQDGGSEDRTRHNRVQHMITFLRNKEGRRPGPPISKLLRYLSRRAAGPR